MTNILPLLGSIEALLDDVKNVRTSELSLKQLATLIDDEYRAENKHMERSCLGSHFVNAGGYLKNNAASFLVSIFKWMTGLFFLVIVGLVVCPYIMMDLFDNVHGCIFTLDANARPTYNISDVPWYFFALQILRIGSTSLNLERKFTVSNINIDSCLIKNPLYRPQRMKCSLCRGEFVYGKLDQDDNTDSPVIRKSQDIQFNVARLQLLLHQHEKMLNRHTMSVNTNRDYIHTVEDLKDNKVLERFETDNTLHIMGTTLSYMSSHIIRKDFPKPQDYFFAAQTFQAFLYIDGKNSSSYTLGRSVLGVNSMYMQCKGSRRVVFSPPDQCGHSCQTLSRIMKPGDIAFYSTTWTVHSEPTNEKSVVFVDTFEWL